MCGAELTSLPDGVQRVARLLQERGHPHAPLMLDGAARTAQQAADALGVALGQIARGIIFRRKADDVAVLVVTLGDRRVDERNVEALVGHGQPPVTLIDRELFRFDEIWAAAA